MKCNLAQADALLTAWPGHLSTEAYSLGHANGIWSYSYIKQRPRLNWPPLLNPGATLWCIGFSGSLRCIGGMGCLGCSQIPCVYSMHLMHWHEEGGDQTQTNPCTEMEHSIDRTRGSDRLAQAKPIHHKETVQQDRQADYHKYNARSHMMLMTSQKDGHSSQKIIVRVCPDAFGLSAVCA